MNATEKLVLQSQVNTLKASIDAINVDAPPVVTPPSSWPRIAPDVLDINLTGPSAVLTAKLLDGSPGYDGQGTAIHYGSMAGGIVYNNGVADLWQKFSNNVFPVWGTDANGLHWLESATDMTQAFAAGVTGNRLIDWKFGHLVPRAEYFSRYMVCYDKCMLKGQGNIGVKGSGLSGPGCSHNFQIGPVLPTGSWQAQDYAYDGEGAQRVEKFAGIFLVPGVWYTIEQRVKANTYDATGYKADGIVEYKINGILVFSRLNVLLFKSGAPQISGFQMHAYDGGMIPPKVVSPPPSLRVRHARLALSTKGWIGPSIEVTP